MMKNIWMVRAGVNAILIDEFKSRNIVALGWGIGDLTDKSEDEIRQLLEEKFPKNSKNSLGKISAVIIKFRYKIKKGDYVLSGDPSTRKYFLGVITSDYYYSEQFEDWGEDYRGYNDTRDVKWLGEISRDQLRESTKTTLGAAITLFNINKKAREDIFNVFSKTHQDEYDKSAKIIRDYLDENNLGDFEQEQFENASKSFYSRFSPEILEKLEGRALLYSIFFQQGDKNSLVYYLEYFDEYKIFGSLGGGSAFKYYLFKYQNEVWRIGSSSNNKDITEDEAIQIGTKIRDAIVNGAKYIKSTNLTSIKDYKNLESQLNEIFEGCNVKPSSNWIHKYYTLLFPDKFIHGHIESVKEHCLLRFNILPEEGYYAKDGQLKFLAEKAGIKFYSLIDEKIVSLFEDFSEEVSGDEGEDIGEKIPEEPEVKKFEADLKRNIIYFGAPGTGKSYNLNQDKDELIKDEKDYERVTFHPDYSYANFVGTYKPVPKADSISYEYVPGPFMRSLVKALKHPEKPFLLIIEEINRSNVAAVFGDVFQLLDRDKNNESRYSIETTEDMRNYLKSELNEDYEKIKIPSNMFIWATMNSADQGVFPMDTAFKRRWEFKYFGINYNEELISNIKFNINNQEISWNDLRKAINNELLSYRINEDKLLGPFFAYNEYIDEEEISDEEFKEIFKNKIIMYLFEDAAKAKRNDLFAGAKENNNVIYSRVCELFDAKGIEIFCDNIKENLLNSDLEDEVSEFDPDIFEESE